MSVLERNTELSALEQNADLNTGRNMNGDADLDIVRNMNEISVASDFAYKSKKSHDINIIINPGQTWLKNGNPENCNMDENCESSGKVFFILFF